MMKQSSDPTIEYVTECLDCHEEMYLPRGSHVLYHAMTGRIPCDGQRLKDAVVEAAKRWLNNVDGNTHWALKESVQLLVEFENSGKFDA